MAAALDKCAGFNLPQSLLDLFRNLKGLLNEYVQMLTRILPVRPKSDQDYQVLCAIANTSALLLSIIDSLATKVISLVADELKPLVKIEDSKEEISTHLRKQLAYIIEMVLVELSPFLVQVGNGNWDQSVLEAAKLPAKIPDIFRLRFTVIDEWLSGDNLNRKRSTFAGKVVFIIHDAMFKQRQLSKDIAWKISVALKEIKSLIVFWTQANSVLARKRIDSEFLPLEIEARVMCSLDPESMAVTYITMSPKPTRDHFKSILMLGGVTAQRERTFLEEFDRQMAILPK